ncbi:MAG TPA: amidohydrolase family protein [Planctomycetota bacterium]|nr:amidohydrolase family protein [Planctomycetota bacterium]
MIYRADIIWAGRGQIIRDGGIHVQKGRIVQLGPFKELRLDNERVQELHDTILLPAFANAHTQLDLSHLRGRLHPGTGFVEWIETVSAGRQGPHGEGRSIRKGLAQVIGGGTVAVGDISVSGKSAEILHTHGLVHSIVFLEVSGFRPADAQRTIDALRRRIEGLMHGKSVRLGISPRSPYAVSLELFGKCIKLGEELDLPMAIHAAESIAEAEFLMYGTGSIRTLMEKRESLPPNWTPPGKRPIPYLQEIGALERSPLLIHCCEVDSDDAAIIARHGCSVAYSPRSSAFFGHAADSLYTLLDAGVNVALGTNGLASNRSLSMLDEMRFLKLRHPDLGWEQIVQMATTGAAQALGIWGGGVLGVYLPADIVAVDPAGGRDLGQKILGEGSSVEFVLRAGRILKKRTTAKKVLV